MLVVRGLLFWRGMTIVIPGMILIGTIEAVVVNGMMNGAQRHANSDTAPNRVGASVAERSKQVVVNFLEIVTRTLPEARKNAPRC
jgi:hypothetical protein